MDELVLERLLMLVDQLEEAEDSPGVTADSSRHAFRKSFSPFLSRR